MVCPQFRCDLLHDGQSLWTRNVTCGRPRVRLHVSTREPTDLLEVWTVREVDFLPLSGGFAAVLKQRFGFLQTCRSLHNKQSDDETTPSTAQYLNDWKS